jgi:hypothetical protein
VAVVEIEVVTVDDAEPVIVEVPVDDTDEVALLVTVVCVHFRNVP